MLGLFLAVSAFAPLTPTAPASLGCARSGTPCASLSSRRAAITGASVAALAAVMPRAAIAEDDDAIYRIAQKNKVALEAEREAKKVKVSRNAAKVEKENAGSIAIVGVVGGASIVLSLPFFYKNVARLFLRYRSVVDSSIDRSQFDKDYQAPTGRRGRR